MRLVTLKILLLAAVSSFAQIRTDMPPRAEPRFPQALTPVRLQEDLFAFDNGTGRDQKVPLDRQAAILRDAGYAGMAVYTGTERLAEITKALSERHLRLLSIYVHSYVDDSGPRIDPGIEKAIEQLKGRETMLLLTVRGNGKDAEKRAVENVQQVADMAARAGLRVCLYPHINFYVETSTDAIRIIRKANRNNVGTALNLYHTVEFHRTRCGMSDLNFTALVKEMLPDLYLVSINGIDGATITRLGEGNFDVPRFLRALNDVGYTGPVGLQCYQVPGDIQGNLEKSRAAWKEMLGRLGQPDPELMPRRPGSGRRPGR
jgi:sugar phosphate isomerase/epimerase